VPRTSSQWESFPRSLLIVLAALALLLVGAYYLLLPAVARAIANRIPAAVTAQISTSVLDGLEGSVLRPTGLTRERQEAIGAAFEGLWPASRKGRYRLIFRDSPQLGANALALPSGTIVVTDGLVQLARDDREILGVLAHEAGHVEARHGLRQVIQGALLTVAIGWMVGDFTSLLAIAPAALAQARYSRAFEREADAYAADALLAHGMSPAFLADILDRIESSQGHGDNASGPVRYLSSHPATKERMDYLRSRK
jgi:Zn-dependent protease with chaperone function